MSKRKPDRKKQARGALLAALLLTFLLAGVVIACGGCANVADGSDPVLVNAERGTVLAFETVHAFLQFEKANQPLIKDKVPAVHELAEQIRRHGPDAFKSLRAATVAYKATRAPADADYLDGQLKAVQALADAARNALIDAQQAKVRGTLNTLAGSY